MDTCFAAKLADPRFFAENRLPAHSDHLYYPSVEEALACGPMTLRQSLNGVWRFHYARQLSLAPDDFWAEDYDYGGWAHIKVPGHIQLQGYDAPQYCNSAYPWDGVEDIVPGQIPHHYNPVGSYLRTFSTPDGWSSVFIHFAGAESAFRVWCNGQYVGYSEDSFTPAEFDLTPFIKAGENRLAVQVYRFSSGSWLEDQDFWRLSGLFRDVFLFTKPKAHIEDLFVRADRNGLLRADLRLSAALAVLVEYSLFDDEGAKLARGQITPSDDTVSFTLRVENPALWSAETPHLYTLLVTVKDGLTRQVLEAVPQRVGFRTFAMEGGLLTLNGKRLVFKGVNRHAFSHQHGRALTHEEMEWDVRFLKQHNFNAVRNSHYPADAYWYTLCDLYGIYLIDECNMETHGTWCDANRREHVLPGDNPDWLDASLDRARSMLEGHKNHPSILMWSCGNESFGGSTFLAMSQWFKQRDDTRLVHYEGIVHDPRYPETSDVRSQMYTSPAKVEAYLQTHAEKPFILCEYAHAMGNSTGNLFKYTALADKYPHYQGGFIWDFIDQGLLRHNTQADAYVATGSFLRHNTLAEACSPYGSFLRHNTQAEACIAYGGDFGDRPCDGDFSCNGVVTADRRPYPRAQEIKYQYQDFVLRPQRDGVTLYNHSLFRQTSGYQLRWLILHDGALADAGEMPCPAVLPGESLLIPVPFEVNAWEGDTILRASLHLRESTDWAPAGFEIAHGQTVLGAPSAPFLGPSAALIDGLQHIGFAKDGFQVLVSRKTGALYSLRFDGRELLTQDGIRPHFWRAPTQNDYGSGLPARAAQWKTASLYPAGTHCQIQGKRIVCRYDLPTQPSAYCTITYAVEEQGRLWVTLTYPGFAGLPEMPLFGVTWRMPRLYDRLRWYGNGPAETYGDRELGAKLGIYENLVPDNLTPYVLPQECGNKTGVRWAELTDAQGMGLRIRCDGHPFEMSALPYTAHELENARHPYELPASRFTVVNVNARQMGVGGDDSWGARTHDEFLLSSEKPWTLTFLLEAAL